MTTTLRARVFIVGADRNEQDKVHAHLYEQTGTGEDYALVPMCEWGWNRSDGFAFSIFRGNGSARGICKTCQGRRKADLPAITEPRGHKTKWI